MSTLLPVLLQVVGICALIGFVSAMAAHLQLQFCIDHRRVKEDAGEPGWKVFGSILAPREFYKEEARWVWRVRDVGLKSFAICLGCSALIAVLATVLDVELGRKKAEQGARANAGTCHASCDGMSFRNETTESES